MALDTPALQAFLAVAETGSTHAAARALGLSQAAVSRRVGRLEDSLGVLLFVRGGHLLRLSPAGTRLLPDVRTHIAGLNQALAEVRANRPDATTTITIGCLATLSLYVLPQILADFFAREKNIRVRILDLSPSQIEDSVSDGTADFALTMLGVGAANMIHEVLAQQPLVLIAPLGHEFASRDKVAWAELQGLPLIGTGPDSANQRLLDSARGSIGITLDWRQQVQRITTAIELVATGIGLAILPLGPELMQKTNIRVVELTDPVITRRIGILRRSGDALPPAAARLRRLIAARLGKKIRMPQ